MFEAILQKKATKELSKLNDPQLTHMLRALDGLSEDSRPQGSIMLKGADGLWKIKVGKYRIINAIFDEVRVVSVTKLCHRKDVYEK